MNNPIIQTQFLDDVVTDIYDVMSNLGMRGTTVTSQWLFNNIGETYDLVHQLIKQTNEEISQVTEYDDKPIDLLDILEWCGKVLVDLSIIQDLEVPYYANPKYIDNAVLILSEKLAEQLAAKAHQEAYYNEYYCKRLAEVLNELCELIKEA